MAFAAFYPLLLLVRLGARKEIRCYVFDCAKKFTGSQYFASSDSYNALKAS